MQQTLLTVIIPTYNEAGHIVEAIHSVHWAAEILVVDSFSSDETTVLAAAEGAKVLQRAYQSPADQKNWAIPKAQHEWVLLLDADERIGVDLASEIQLVVQKDPPIDAFWIGRKNLFMDQWIRYSGWQHDRVVRLIRRDAGRYKDVQVHEEIDLKGLRVGTLSHKMLHYTFRNLDHYLDKTQRYARWSAQDHLARTSQVTYYHLVGKPLFRFFKHFVLQRGFLDGYVGLIISSVMAWGVFLRYVYLRELKRKKS